MWSRERILIIIPATLLLCSLLLSTFPQLTYIPCFSLVSEQRTEEDFLEWMIKQQERRARVARMCASDPNLRNSQRAGMEYSFLFDPDHNLLGCLQPKVSEKQLVTYFWTFQIKVGSTTWHQHFVGLANEKRRTQLEKRSRQDQASIWWFKEMQTLLSPKRIKK